MKKYLITYQKKKQQTEVKKIDIIAPTKEIAKKLFFSFFCRDNTEIISIEILSKEKEDQLMMK